ncbi:hypothetical protein [Streptomyces sp. NPDC006739]|uniref:hypothetical protein n=1 Tax=Streptomyces sp. NPDC006739 TaxID=3364763 RepID=UPI0036787F72
MDPTSETCVIDRPDGETSHENTSQMSRPRGLIGQFSMVTVASCGQNALRRGPKAGPPESRDGPQLLEAVGTPVGAIHPSKTGVFIMHKGKLITGGLLALAVVGVAVHLEQSPSATKTASAQGNDIFDPTTPNMRAAPTSEADTFKLWVAQEGTPPEKAAIRHVTRLRAHTGNHRVDIRTDWDSRFASRYTAQAQQITIAYRTWQTGTGQSQVTVYASDGQVIPTQRS